MKYQHDSYHNSAPPSQMISYCDKVKDTDISHMNFEDFLQRVDAAVTEDMLSMKQSSIHLVSTFPLAALEPEFVIACAKNFDPTSRTIKDQDGKTIVSFDPETVDKIFQVPLSPVCINITTQKALDRWNEDTPSCTKFINENWLLNKRPNIARWPKGIRRTEFKEEISDLITLFSHLAGLKTSSIFEPWMYKYISIIVQSKKKIFWGEMISDMLCEQLSQVVNTFTFYMNSYLVYIAASLGSFSGLSTKGDRSLVLVWEYFPQLVLKASRSHYRRVQDAFYGHFMCLFDKSLLNKRVSDEALG